MAQPSREIAGASIVAIGRFNPSIFQPAWFASQGLMSQTEAENVDMRVVHPNLASFSSDLLDVQVTPDSFMCGSAVAPAPMLADMVIGALKVLHHTPVFRVGINREAHYKVADEEVWHRFGHSIVPPDKWKALKNPGLRTVIEQGERPDDDYQGWIQVKIEPSVRVFPGLFFAVNDHYEVAGLEELGGADKASALVTEKFELSLSRSDEIIGSLVELAQ